MSDAKVEISAPRVWVVLAKAYKAMAGFVEQHVSREGLGLTDFMVLEVLLHRGPLTISAIGEKVLLANASMTSAIDRLEAKTLVQRTSSEEDRRIRLVTLTSSGKRFIAAIYERHEQELEQLMSSISAKERTAIHSSLKKIGLAAAAVNEHE